jgi:hypothetical protein
VETFCKVYLGWAILDSNKNFPFKSILDGRTVTAFGIMHGKVNPLKKRSTNTNNSYPDMLGHMSLTMKIEKGRLIGICSIIDAWEIDPDMTTEL